MDPVGSSPGTKRARKSFATGSGISMHILFVWLFVQLKCLPCRANDRDVEILFANRPSPSIGGWGTHSDRENLPGWPALCAFCLPAVGRQRVGPSSLRCPKISSASPDAAIFPSSLSAAISEHRFSLPHAPEISPRESSRKEKRFFQVKKKNEPSARAIQVSLDRAGDLIEGVPIRGFCEWGFSLRSGALFPVPIQPRFSAVQPLSAPAQSPR